MTNLSKETVNSTDYSSRTPSYYLSTIKPDVLASFSAEQLEAIRYVLHEAVPKPSPKLVDFRFVVDLIVSRFYVVLLIGKDRRRKPRKYVPEKLARVGNLITAIVLLTAANLTISAFILLAGYLLKSAIGINILPGHFPSLLKQFLSISS